MSEAPAHLLWLRTMRGYYTPQKAYDGHGGKPFIDAGLRGLVASTHALKDAERDLPLDELATLYPAPMTPP